MKILLGNSMINRKNWALYLLPVDEADKYILYGLVTQMRYECPDTWKNRLWFQGRGELVNIRDRVPEAAGMYDIVAIDLDPQTV